MSAVYAIGLLVFETIIYLGFYYLAKVKKAKYHKLIEENHECKCYNKIDRFLWRNYQLNKYEHLQRAKFVNYKVQLSFRTIVGVFYTGYAIYVLASSELSELKYFTEWGINLTALTFMLLSLDQLRQIYWIQKHEDYN